MTEGQTTPPGWYPQPDGTQRWWDGSAWTEHIHDPAAAAAAAAAAPVAAATTPVVAAAAPVVAYGGQPQNVAAREVTGPRPVGRKQGAWGLWWLCIITFGIYYFVWYQRINNELLDFVGDPSRPTDSQWWTQLIPIYGFVTLVATANRVNGAHASIGSPVRVSGGVSVVSCFWFGSQTRYLQRRINALWDTASAVAVR